MATNRATIFDRLNARLAEFDTVQADTSVDFLAGREDVLPPSADQLRQQRVSLRESAGLGPAATFREFARPDVTAVVQEQAPIELRPFLQTFSFEEQPTIGAPRPGREILFPEPERQLPGLQQAPERLIPPEVVRFLPTALQALGEISGFTIQNPESKFFDLSPEEQQRFLTVQQTAATVSGTREQFDRLLGQAGFGDIDDPFLPFGSTAGFAQEFARGLGLEAQPAVEAAPLPQLAGRFGGEIVKFGALIGALQAAGLGGVAADVGAGLISGTQRELQAEEFDPLAPFAEAAELGTFGAVLRLPFAIRDASKATAAAGRPTEATDILKALTRRPVVKPTTKVGVDQQKSAEEAIEALVKVETQGRPPKEGLVVANIGTDGNIYYGLPGELHLNLTEKFGDVVRANIPAETPIWKKIGFAGPDGKFLTRKEALTKTKVKPSQSVEGQLDALDLREQTISPFRIGGAQQTLKQANAIANVYGKIDLTGKAKTGTFKERAKDALLRVNTLLADDLAPLEFVEKKIRGVDKLDWRKIDPISSPTMMARAAARAASGKARIMLLHGTFDLNGQTTGPGLRDILKPVADDFTNFVTYSVARRAVELHGRGINPGVSLQDAQLAISALDNPIRLVAHEGVTRFENNVLKYLVDAGGLSEDAARTIMDLNKSHIPFKRAIEGRTFIGGGGKKLADLGSPVKPIRGSDLPIRNPIASILENTTAIISVADKVRVGKALIELTEQFPTAQTWIRKIKAPVESRRVSVESIKRQLENAGVDLAEADMNQVLDIYSSGGIYRGKDNVVSFVREGKREFFKVDERLYGTLKAMDELHLHPMIDFLLGRPARAIRLGATGLNAGFGLITNPLRDAFTFGLQTEFTSGSPLLIGRGLMKRLNPTDDINLLFKRSGADFSQFLGMDRRSMKRTIDEVLANTETKRALNIVKHPIEAAKDLFSITEAAPRLAEFEGALRFAEQRFGPNSPQAFILGNIASAEATVNFRRAGALGKYINQMIPFWNAQIQGVSRFARFAKANPTKAAIKGIAAVTIPTIGMWMLNKDRPWYREAPAWMRYGFWNIETGVNPDGSPRILRIPRPFEWGVAFGTAPEMALDYWYSIDPAVVEQGLDYMREQTIPIGLDHIPPGMKIPFELASNYDYFRERPIDPLFEMKYKAPEDRFSPFTIETAKFLGRQFGMSPRKIQFLLSSTTGGLAVDVARTAERITGVAPTQADLPANIPVVGRLFQRTQTPEARVRNIGFQKRELISRIRSLRKAGQGELANEELRRFNIRFPDFAITNKDLRRKR